MKGRYAEAGVDIDAGNKFVDMIKPIVSRTFKPGVMSDIGGFAGLFSLNVQQMKKPVLIASTDGVGTKLKVAFMMDKHDTVGIDLVAMCVNDIVVQGASPLFFLDYLAMGKLNLERAKDILKGIADGCLDAGCSLIGGETAEMPGMYSEGEYDLAGFVVGLADNSELLDGSEIAVGHQLIGIASSGLHSNGYSLVRKVFFDEMKLSIKDFVPELGRTLGEELLEPTRIYVKAVTAVRRAFKIFGISHITGGGFTDNIPRILPKRCKAVINLKSWTPPAVFAMLRDGGNISDEEMLRTFNNGLGLIIVVRDKDLSEVISRFNAMDLKAYHIGLIEERSEKEPAVQYSAL